MFCFFLCSGRKKAQTFWLLRWFSQMAYQTLRNFPIQCFRYTKRYCDRPFRNITLLHLRYTAFPASRNLDLGSEEARGCSTDNIRHARILPTEKQKSHLQLK